jgi:beta-mannosidase
VLQAEGIKIGAEHFRRIMPRNMGSLYWQANDCWQVASWSGMDYFGRWKALMFYTKRFYNPTLVSPHVEDGKLNVYVVSDSPEIKPAELIVTLMDLSGKTLATKRANLLVEPLKGKSYLSVPLAELLVGADEGNIVLTAELKMNGKTVSTNDYFFKPFKEMRFSRPEIKTEIKQGENGLRVTLSTDRVAKAVYLSGLNQEGRFADNYFNLIPDSKMEIEFYPNGKMSAGELRGKLKIRSLVDAF